MSGSTVAGYRSSAHANRHTHGIGQGFTSGSAMRPRRRTIVHPRTERANTTGTALASLWQTSQPSHSGMQASLIDPVVPRVRLAYPGRHGLSREFIAAATWSK